MNHSFWQHIELRHGKERGARELRPGSYLVTPTISAARRAMLQNFNVQLVEMGQEDFAMQILKSMEMENQKGFTALLIRRSQTLEENAVQRVSDLRTQKGDHHSEFLMGVQPQWSDIVSGIAIKREFEEGLKTEVEQSQARVALFTGTAGSGKSTTIMRLALEFQAEGKDVLWLNLDAGLRTNDYRRAVRETDADVLVIDDADQFGNATGNFLRELAIDNADLLILAAMRTTRLDRLQVEEHLTDVPRFTYAIPHLEDSDIEYLIEALTTANRLGHLKGLSHSDQTAAFKSQAGRQLLVAMIQATSNERFDEKVDSECHDLPEEQGLIYATVALATSLRQYLARDEILLATGDSSNESLNRIQRLIDQRLLIETQGFQIRLRHRVVADRAVDYYRREGSLREPIIGLLWTMATKTHPQSARFSREMVVLTKLMSHDFMISLTDDRDIPREAYSQVEKLLDWNYHYYLQRGSYEVEIGDLDLAKNFLDSAKAMAPDDYMVQTAWAYMTIKRAALNAGAVNARERAEEAFLELEDAIERRGRSDFYPYHVYGSQGLSWVHRAALGPDEKNRFLSRLLQVVNEGVKYHPRQPELRQLASDVERDYLMTAVKPAS
jgi:tetratricopeptide (TPR) repeat protein